MRQKTAKAARKVMRKEEGRLIDRFKAEVRALPLWRRAKTGLTIAAGGPAAFRALEVFLVLLLVSWCWGWAWLIGRALG